MCYKVNEVSLGASGLMMPAGPLSISNALVDQLCKGRLLPDMYLPQAIRHPDARINGEILVVLHPLTQLIKLTWPSQLQGCLEDVLKLLLKFLLGFGVGVFLGSTRWCFRNVGRVLMLKL